MYLSQSLIFLIFFFYWHTTINNDKSQFIIYFIPVVKQNYIHLCSNSWLGGGGRGEGGAKVQRCWFTSLAPVWLICPPFLLNWIIKYNGPGSGRCSISTKQRQREKAPRCNYTVQRVSSQKRLWGEKGLCRRDLDKETFTKNLWNRPFITVGIETEDEPNI